MTSKILEGSYHIKDTNLCNKKKSTHHTKVFNKKQIKINKLM